MRKACELGKFRHEEHDNYRKYAVKALLQDFGRKCPVMTCCCLRLGVLSATKVLRLPLRHAPCHRSAILISKHKPNIRTI